MTNQERTCVGIPEGSHAIRQTIKARYHDGVLQPLEPLDLQEEAEVEVTVESEVSVSREEILRQAARVYQDLTAEDIAQLEAISLNRQQFFREPAV